MVPFPYDITYWALFLFLSGTWATSGVLQIVMSQVKPPQNDHHNYLLHFHFLFGTNHFSCFKHVSFSYIIIGAFFNWIMRYKNLYLVSDSVWQIFCNIWWTSSSHLLIVEDPRLLHTIYISSSYSFLPLMLGTSIFIPNFNVYSCGGTIMNKYIKTSYGKYLATDQKPMGEFKIFCWHDAIIMVVHFTQL